jgi:hypothetical protein
MLPIYVAQGAFAADMDFEIASRLALSGDRRIVYASAKFLAPKRGHRQRKPRRMNAAGRHVGT